ncbi:PGAP1-like protein [Ancylostoma ceylanicum]|uniref:GPI inositol-deacylase n=1 Tax=Ancylostoma ceylanicum TaxID=53326 RepID=A0A0D6LA78_9BILA|nr:PGAP1-like protein [Ancylostoma ceylanicum]
MTYMWRYISLVPFNVDGNDVSRYGLYRYMEGFVNEKTMAISHDHIPVLFVPGSGGSAKQVRSVASIMMNKTEMTSAPFRMHFYAVDFDEELSFLSGSILNRQRDFVVRAISTIQKMYSRKVVLIGHSLGGTVLHALPAHPRFSISNMGLVIILASPISAPPIVMDEAMVSFYESMQRAWVSRNDELRHVGLVSYSGGSKDFQVPDHLATIHGSHHIVHRPSWSIRGVDTPVDHLCILWCNQLTRHSTRILYDYGIEEVSKDVPRPANALVQEFFHEESHANANGSGSLKDANSKKFYELEFISPYMVYTALLESPCDMSMLFIYPNTLARSATAKESVKVMTIDLPYELSSSVGHIALEGKTGCDFDLTVKPDVFYAWYLLLISNVNVVAQFTFSVLVALTLLEKLKSFDRIRFRSRLGYYINCGIAVLLFRAIPLCLKVCNAALTLVVILLVPVNPYLANAAIALLIALFSQEFLSAKSKEIREKRNTIYLAKYDYLFRKETEELDTGSRSLTETCE